MKPRSSLVPLLLLALASCVEPGPAIGARRSSGDSVVPHSCTVTYPSAEEWATINKRAGTVTPPADDDE